jgi:hypothetical protein
VVPGMERQMQQFRIHGSWRNRFRGRGGGTLRGQRLRLACQSRGLKGAALGRRRESESESGGMRARGEIRNPIIDRRWSWRYGHKIVAKRCEVE